MDIATQVNEVHVWTLLALISNVNENVIAMTLWKKVK